MRENIAPQPIIEPIEGSPQERMQYSPLEQATFRALEQVFSEGNSWRQRVIQGFISEIPDEIILGDRIGGTQMVRIERENVFREIRRRLEREHDITIKHRT
ncbi:MAG: hypothetical protein HYV40_02175 [Candidatus Levybacteria bacterium]|nr:hypothetical protein [Candidatus Levybacteria bacterium]